MASFKNVKKGFYRILTATTLTLGLMMVMSIFETAIAGEGQECGQHPIHHHHRRQFNKKAPENVKTPKEWFFCELENSIFLDSLDGFAMIVALFLFLLETPDRTQQAQYEAWQVVDASHGLKTSYARIQALQDLNEDQVSIKGLSALEADLRNIVLNGADLRNVDFQGSDLRGADLRGANLSNANLTNVDFSNANLANARLSSSNLTEANFVETNLSNVDFVGAIIADANFVRAKLERAYFGDNNFTNTNLKDADIKKTKFFGVENLAPAQIKSASNWQEAIYDAALTKELGL